MNCQGKGCQLHQFTWKYDIRIVVCIGEQYTVYIMNEIVSLYGEILTRCNGAIILLTGYFCDKFDPVELNCCIYRIEAELLVFYF